MCVVVCTLCCSVVCPVGGVWCGVVCGVCGVCGVVRLGMRKTPPCVDSKCLRVCVQDASVCTGKTPACVPSPARSPKQCVQLPLRPSVASHSIRYVCCHFTTSGARRASHQRMIIGTSAMGRSLVTFSETRKTSLCKLAAATFHSAPPSPRIPPLLLSFPLSRPEGPLG